MAGRGKLLTGAVAAAAVAGFALFWLVTAPHPLAASALPQDKPDLANGELMYHAAGCYSCHKPAPELKLADANLPAGGAPLKTPVGTFYPPNLTPDAATGIGTMSDIDFVNAVQRGLSPEGEHLIPAFPYASYAHMKVEDVLDIRAYLASLKPVTSPEKAPDMVLEPLLRRGVGLWKLMALNTTPWQPDPTQTASWNRGSYLVNGPGHCAECHTPRDIFMVPKTAQAFMGGAHPGGEGKVPSLHNLVGSKRYADQADVAQALAYGEMGGYKHLSSGGMGEVQGNIAQLPQPDIDAIAEYLVSLK
jgi:mono/diheme cytochrome c family protein